MVGADIEVARSEGRQRVQGVAPVADCRDEILLVKPRAMRFVRVSCGEMRGLDVQYIRLLCEMRELERIEQRLKREQGCDVSCFAYLLSAAMPRLAARHSDEHEHRGDG